MKRKLGVLLGLLLIWFAIKVSYDTLREPVVERLTITSSDLPVDAPNVTIALVADIHMAKPLMSPARAETIVEQVNALEPDIIALAGDYVTQMPNTPRDFTAQQIIAPLAGFKARLGTVLVAGNHDYWYGWDELEQELAASTNITVLRNEAALLGPLAIGGVDDESTDHDDLAATLQAMASMEGVPVILTHSPDIFPDLPKGIALMMAGHTHCGQIAYPWGGSPFSVSAYGDTYACGAVRQDGKLLVTSGGLGTSLLPIRFFTKPEIWLIEIAPAAKEPPSTLIRRSRAISSPLQAE
jgi:predicted MPP superfamily phosphohydrolase